MTELQIAAKVASHPLVVQYRKATQMLHREMVSKYGVDYAEPEVKRSGLPSQESQRGHTRMTQAHEDLFNSLLRGAAIIRRDVRNSLV